MMPNHEASLDICSAHGDQEYINAEDSLATASYLWIRFVCNFHWPVRTAAVSARAQSLDGRAALRTWRDVTTFLYGRCLSIFPCLNNLWWHKPWSIPELAGGAASPRDPNHKKTSCLNSRVALAFDATSRVCLCFVHTGAPPVPLNPGSHISWGASHWKLFILATKLVNMTSNTMRLLILVYIGNQN